MSALALYLEDEGIACTCIALVREHALRMRPPRALWVPFALGRPFGVPNDAAFQREVLLALLDLFGADSGPVLRDFPREAPAELDAAAPWVCPVSFAKPDAAQTGDIVANRAAAEVRELAPWYELSVQSVKRTTIGVSGKTPAECVQMLAAHCMPGALADPREPAALADRLRWAAADLKAYYFEAAAARPGGAPGTQLEAWFWEQTAAARLLLALRAACLACPAPQIHDIGDFALVPPQYVP